MRLLQACGAVFALLAAAELLPIRAAEPSKGSENTTPWYRRIFGGSDKPTAPAKDVNRPQPKEIAAKTMQEEHAAYLQRLMVITKLRQIALETNNDELLTQVDELEKQASEVFQKKVAHLPGIKLTSLASDEALDRRLPKGAPERPLRSAIKDAKGASASKKTEDQP